MPVEGAGQPPGFPHRADFGVRAGPPRNAGELPPRAHPRRPVPAPGRVGEQVPIDGLPDLVGDMQPDRLGQVITHPPAGLDVGLGGGLHAAADQPEPIPQHLRIGGALAVSGPIRPAPIGGVTLQRPPQPKHCGPLPLQPAPSAFIGDVEFQPDHRVDHRAGQELPAQHRHPNHHLRSQTPHRYCRPLLARNRNDVVVAHHTLTHLLTPNRIVLGDGGHGGIPTITTPRRDRTGRYHPRPLPPESPPNQGRAQHIIARLKDWQVLRQRRRRGEAINHALHIRRTLEPQDPQTITGQL